MCDCIEQAAQELEGTNTVLDIPFRINLKTGQQLPPRLQIATCKRDSKRREKAAFILATYCPFCGEKYETQTEEAAPLT